MPDPQLDASSRVPTRPAVWATLLLALLLIVARLALIGHPSQVHPDEDRFMRGIGFPQQYPVQHPGYPLWIGLGTVGAWLGLSRYMALEIWSIAASVAAPVMFYRGLRWVVRDELAWCMALAFGVNPIIWFTGLSALTYMPGGAIGLAVIGFCWRAYRHDRAGDLRWAAILLAIGTGIRTDLLSWLGPMVAWIAWRHRWRRGIEAMLILAIGVATCLLVTSWLYNRADVSEPHPELVHTIERVLATSVFKLGFVDGLARNALKLAVSLTWGFGIGVVLIPVAATTWRRWPGGAAPFLVMWITPLLLFLFLIHMAEHGYTMLLIPAGYLVIALGLQVRLMPRRAVCVAIVVVACSLVQFIVYPWRVDSTGWKRVLDEKAAFQSAQGLLHIDQRWLIHEPGDFWRTAAHGAPASAASQP